ncbi:MAG: hypothetical protein E5299_00547 [Burkholderia gladioli]|nr:MAG: hypothetical protein E5299_00547 [Burkholderia gladioli]
MPRKCARIYTRQVSRRHTTVSGIGRPYNAGLIKLENVTIWIDEAVLARIPDAIPTRGRPRLYGDTLIQVLLGVKSVY